MAPYSCATVTITIGIEMSLRARCSLFRVIVKSMRIRQRALFGNSPLRVRSKCVDWNAYGIRGLAMFLLLSGPGCATTNMWDETGRSRVQIVDAKIVSQGDADPAITIIGTKTVPVVPFLFDWSSEGEVDSMPISLVDKENGSFVAEIEGIWKDNGDCNLKLLKRKFSLSDGRLPQTEQICAIGRETRPLLISDLHRYRRFVAVPVDDVREETNEVKAKMIVLKRPYVGYDGNSYCRSEGGVRVITERIVFMPFAVVADVVMFPFVIWFLPFVHM